MKFLLSHMISGLYLLQQRGNTNYINDYMPKTIALSGDLSVIILSCFSGNSSSIFAFTMGKEVCYAYKFVYNNESYSIVIASQCKQPKLFLDFLGEARYFFNKNQQYDATARFNIIWSVLASWRENEEMCQYTSFNKTFSMKQSTDKYHGFKASQYFGSCTDYTKLWKSILLNKRVLVISDNEEDLAPAVFAILNLISPFEFQGSFLISTSSKDARQLELENKYSVIGIVAKDFKGIKNLRDFGSCLKVEKTRRKEVDFQFSRIQKKSQLLYSLIETISNRNLETDPYHEFIGRSIITDDIDIVLCPEMKEKTLTFNELKEFENTKTFSALMKTRLFRDELRNSFLSVSPSEIMDKIPDSQLGIAYGVVQDIMRKFPMDTHFQSVLRKHRRTIESRLGTKIIHSSDSSDTAY